MYIVNNNKKLNLVCADTFLKNLIGLSFKKNINYAMRFKCKSIELFFMRERIDICITDKDNNILFLYPNYDKRLLFKKSAYFIYELPLNSIYYLDLKLNSKLNIK